LFIDIADRYTQMFNGALEVTSRNVGAPFLVRPVLEIYPVKCSLQTSRAANAVLPGIITFAHTLSHLMENDMRHTVKNSIKENMHALLECIFVDYANLLRENYPDRTIRNAAVFLSGVPEFARLGFIELVDARAGIREGIPDSIARRIKRSKHQPIWIPGPNFPANPMDMYDQMKPLMRGDEIVWRHIPTQRRNARPRCMPRQEAAIAGE
jgi:hypothetical protein